MGTGCGDSVRLPQFTLIIFTELNDNIIVIVRIDGYLTILCDFMTSVSEQLSKFYEKNNHYTNPDHFIPRWVCVIWSKVGYGQDAGYSQRRDHSG